MIRKKAIWCHVMLQTNCNLVGFELQVATSVNLENFCFSLFPYLRVVSEKKSDGRRARRSLDNIASHAVHQRFKFWEINLPTIVRIYFLHQLHQLIWLKPHSYQFASRHDLIFIEKPAIVLVEFSEALEGCQSHFIQQGIRKVKEYFHTARF